jgi:deoxyribonuclease-4
LRLGIHLYTFGSLRRAASRAAEIGADTLQIFTASPRMWRAGTPDPLEIEALQAIRREHGIDPLAVHVNYLVNLASRDPEIRAKSIVTFRGELDRAAKVGAEFLVVHPGSYKGQTLDAAISACADGLCQAADGFTGAVTVLIENTAGCGCNLCSTFEELHAIRDLALPFVPVPIGYCLDTCHLFAAGFDITTKDGLRSTIRRAGDVLGLENVPVFHANDSKTPLGSRVDRHARIGKGYIGREPFRRLLAHPKLRGKTFISETPVEAEGDDRRNMATLRSLAPVRGKTKHILAADERR